MLHELPLTADTLHGRFSPELEPVLTIDPGDQVRFATLDAGWGIEAPDPNTPTERAHFTPRDEDLDPGHALVGPIAVCGARPGTTLVVHLDEIRAGAFGLTTAGGTELFLNEALGVETGEEHVLVWRIDASAGTATDQHGRTIAIRPFLGVLGMPPPEPGNHPTSPPRIWGGNLDCKELVAGSTLYLPISIAGAHFSAGDGHGRQGDGEVSGLAIECPLDRVTLTLDLRDDLELQAPIAETVAGWLTFGLDEDLDEAAAMAMRGMLDLMGRELDLARKDALALASLVVDLRVTQVVNGVRGVHAVLPRDAICMGDNPA